MSDRRGWPTSALAAAAIGACASYASGVAGIVSLWVAIGTLLLAYGRGAGWSLSRRLERPRLFAILSAVYVPLFVADFLVSLRSSPFSALIRLVVFLLAAVVLSGDTDRPHRPVLLGLLLLVSAASETTDIWYAAPLVAFAVAAVMAQMRATLLTHQPAGSSKAPGLRAAPVAGIVAGSLLLGGLIFLVIPRLGAGWGRGIGAPKSEVSLETGLSDAVSLGTVGKVKQRRRIAFTAQLRGSAPDPESIYWRARAWSKWTGDGWVKEGRQRETLLDLPAGRAVSLPGETLETMGRDLEAEIDMKLERLPALVAPGRPIWIRTNWPGTLRVGPDASLAPSEGRVPRHYEVGVRAIGTGFLERGTSAARLGGSPVAPAAVSGIARAGPVPPDREREMENPAEQMVEGAVPGRPIPAIYLDAGKQESAVRAWAAGIGPAETDPGRLARAFVRDLSSRPYSLDTRAVDPGHPIASFLAGAPAHCEYFASAMALGLRLRGIPSRVVVGYIGSDKVPFSRTLVVRESRAHLWVEALLPGKGWVTFDPTPPAGRVTPSEWGYLVQGAWERAVLSWDGMVIGLDIQDQADMALMARDKVLRALALIRSGGAWMILGLPILLGAIVFAFFRGRRRFGWRRIGPDEMPAFYRRLLRMAEARGLRPLPAETSREFARRAAGALHDEEAVRLVSGLYERVRFGGIPPTAAELSSVREALGRLGRPLR